MGYFKQEDEVSIYWNTALVSSDDGGFFIWNLCASNRSVEDVLVLMLSSTNIKIQY